jgi:PAS domain-containing protein
VRDDAAAVAVASSGSELLDPPLQQVVRETGAYAGGVYLPAPGERVLRLAVITDIPTDLAKAWARVGLEARVPVTDAIRERRLVWVGAEGDLPRLYPRVALALPYPFAIAAAPITTGASTTTATGTVTGTTTGATTWGGLVLLWPGTHPPQLTEEERGAISAACHRLGELTRQAAESGRPVLPGAEPRVLARQRPRTPEPAEALAAVDLVERLPEGNFALDLEGRISYLSATAADLLGRGIPDLLGTLPREALPWLDELVYEDRYRYAVVSQQPASFTARRPPDQWLSFQLYPSASGITVRISPSHITDHILEGPGPERPAPPAVPTRAGALYNLMYLAATLTEAVTVQDVVDMVADQIMPAFGAQALAMLAAEGDRLRIIGSRGYSSEIIDRFDGTPLSSPSPGVRALTTGNSGFFANRRELEHAYPTRAGKYDDMDAWAFLPLIASGHPVGSCVLAYDRPRVFTPEDRAALTSLAGLIAQALDRARIYDAKHQLAHDLQANLLPHALPRLPGLDVAARYLPATRGMDIGG